MPDHIHMFTAATAMKIEFKNWVKYWKSQFTKRHNVAEHPEEWPYQGILNELRWEEW